MLCKRNNKEKTLHKKDTLQ